MNKNRMRPLVLAVVATVCIAGCSGQSDEADDQVAQKPALAENTDQNLADDERLDAELAAEPNEDQLDLAEYFFTEADRQWFCSVTTEMSVFTDQLYVERFGTAWFELFGLVEWSRHDELDQLEVKTISGQTFSLREIFASNTILEFQRHSSESAASDLYECILTTRDTGNL